MGVDKFKTMKRLFLMAALVLPLLAAVAQAETEKAPASFSFNVEVEGDNSWNLKWGYSVFGDQQSDVEAAHYLANSKLASETTWHYRADQRKVRAILSFNASAQPLKYEFFDDKDKLIRSQPIVINAKNKRALASKQETGIGALTSRYDASGRLAEINFLCSIDNTRIAYALDTQGRVLTKTQNRSPHLQKTQYFSSRPGLRRGDQMFKLATDKTPGNVFTYQYNARGNIVKFNGTAERDEDGGKYNLHTIFTYGDDGRFSESASYVNEELAIRQQFKRDAKGEMTGIVMKQYDKGVLQTHVVSLMKKSTLEYIYYDKAGQIDSREIFSRKPYQIKLKKDYINGKKKYQTEYKDGKATFATQYKADGTVEWKKPVNPDGSVSLTTPEPEKTN